MKYFKTTLISTAIVILIALLTIKIYYHYDLPLYGGEQQLISISDTVEVYSDQFGVPHIFAKNNEDLFFTAGYIIARERLFQLSLLAAIMNGEISSLLGDDYQKHDDYLKKNDMFSINDVDISIIDEDNLRLIEQYCSGINSYIDELNGSIPISFKITNSKPIKWSVTDVVKSLSIMTNNIAKQNRERIVQNAIKQYYGETRYSEIATVDTTQTFINESLALNNQKIKNDILELIGATGSLIGSDALIISSSKTVTQQPILIFDDVWDLQQPTKWFDIHLKGGDFNVEGAVMPGFPFPLIGRSHKAAFALTGRLSINDINSIFDLAEQSEAITQLENLVYVDTSGFYIDNNTNTHRFDVLQNRIEGIDNIQINDIVKILADNRNPEKANFAKIIANIYYANSSEPDNIIETLLNWDGDESGKSSETLLINTINKKLLENIFKDELSLIGDDIYKTFTQLPEFSENSLINVLRNDNSNWIDNINTLDYKETLSDVAISSVEEALTEITEKHGTTNWQWSYASKRSYKHILDSSWVKNFIHNLNIVQLPAEGSNSNLNINEFYYLKDFQQVSGSVLRKIYDLSNSENSYSIMPTGQSGHPKSPHYSDQVELFTNNSFRVVEFSEENIRSSDAYKKLTLLPLK